MQIRHYTWILWRSLGFILVFSCIAAGATYAISKFILPPVYQASALIQVNAAGDSSTVYADNAQAVADALLVTTTPVLQAVSAKLPGVTLAQLKAEVSASPLASSRIIEIRAQADDPQQAATIANTVAQNFITLQVAKVTSALQYSLQQTSQSMKTAKADLATDQARLTTLQNSHASETAIAQQTNVVNNDQFNYDSLLTNYQQLQQRLLQVNSLLVQVQKASPPATPLSPRTTLNTLVAGALGALLVIVFVLVRDWVDNSIRTPEDVAHLTLLEPLGSLPLSQRPLSSAATLEGDGVVEQAFLVMSTTISKQPKRRTALLLTSLQPGAGTTTVAVHLAVSLAQAGKRVMLVDANQQRSSLAGFFQRPNSKGLLDSLSEISRLREGEVFSWLDQYATEIPNLWLLPAGQHTTFSDAALRSPEIRLLVHGMLGTEQNARGNGREGEGFLDYILFDAPSLKESADPIALTVVADYTVLVVEAGKEHAEALNKAGAVFQRLDSPVVGVVINRQTARHRPYFYVENYWQQRPAFTESLPTKSELLAGTSNRAVTTTTYAREEKRSAPLPSFSSEPSAQTFHAMDETRSAARSFPPATPLPSTVIPSRPVQNRTREFGDPNH